MSRYRKISTRIHADLKVKQLSKPMPNGKDCFIHLLIGPSTGIIPGLYRAGPAELAEQLEWPKESFQQSFQECISLGLAKNDWGAPLVWVPKAIKHNKPQNPNVVKSWSEAWDELPECQLKLEAFQYLERYLQSLGKSYLQSFRESCPEPLGNHCRNQEQEQEQDQDQEIAQDLDQPAVGN